MAKYEFVDVSDDLVDMVVEVDFESPLPLSKTKDVLSEILYALELGPALPVFFEGLPTFKVDEKGIGMHFRFSRKSDDLARLGQTERDELGEARVLFVIHVFAKFDRVHRLGQVPFPPDFRNLIELPIWVKR